MLVLIEEACVMLKSCGVRWGVGVLGLRGVGVVGQWSGWMVWW